MDICIHLFLIFFFMYCVLRQLQRWRREEYHLWKCSLHLWACVLTSKYRCFCIDELNYVPFSTLTSRKTSKQMMWGLDIFAVCVCNWNKNCCCCSSKTVYKNTQIHSSPQMGSGRSSLGWALRECPVQLTLQPCGTKCSMAHCREGCLVGWGSQCLLFLVVNNKNANSMAGAKLGMSSCKEVSLFKMVNLLLLLLFA